MPEEPLQPATAMSQRFWRSLPPWGFALAMGLLNRLVILVGMMLVVPLLPASGGERLAIGWRVLVGWDSVHYIGIATSGYEYAPDGIGHNVAFFPMLPLFIKAGMVLGLPPGLAGALANNVAFLGALVVLAGWMHDRYGLAVARWSVAALAWCPFSLFGTVVYTEGLFLLFSTAALQAFDRRQYIWTAVWGSLASATRLPGLTLAPAFLLVAWNERRSWSAYVAAIASAGGVLFFSLFCWVQFHEPLAFLWVQKAWYPVGLTYGEGWLKSLVQITLGTTAWSNGRIVDPLYPVAFLVLCGLGFLLWRFRKRLGNEFTYYAACASGLLLWLLAGSPLINAVMIWGGVYLLWRLRHELPPVAMLYGVFESDVDFKLWSHDFGRATCLWSRLAGDRNGSTFVAPSTLGLPGHGLFCTLAGQPFPALCSTSVGWVDCGLGRSVQPQRLTVCRLPCTFSNLYLTRCVFPVRFKCYNLLNLLETSRDLVQL